MSATAEAYVLFLFFIIVMILLYGFFQKRLKMQEDLFNNYNVSGLSVLIQNRLSRRYNIVELAQQEQNIYNISGRVPGQNPPQYPDAFLSIDHVSITTELNKPPKYDDSPPSYEEALKLAIAQSNSMQTLQAEQPQVHQSSTSPSSSTPVVVPAVPSRTTE